MMGRLDAAIEWAKAQPKWFVYAICDEHGNATYIGATDHPERRYQQHIAPSARYQLPLRQWVQSSKHTFEVLDTYATKRMMLDAEREYIAYLTPRFNHC